MSCAPAAGCDNAWMVSEVRHYHIADSESSKMISTKSGDCDVAGVFWRNIDDISEMYADHLKWVRDAKSNLMNLWSEVVRVGRSAAQSHCDPDPAVFYMPPERLCRANTAVVPSLQRHKHD